VSHEDAAKAKLDTLTENIRHLDLGLESYIATLKADPGEAQFEAAVLTEVRALLDTALKLPPGQSGRLEAIVQERLKLTTVQSVVDRSRKR
jgi:hypothetical protein